MISVKVSDALIEQVYTEGNEIQSCKAIQGLPEGCKLVGASYDGYNVELKFNDGSDEVREIDIIMQRID